MSCSIGIGSDIHRLVEGRRFILGGVVIPFTKGEDAYSDGDVLTHAIIDALLGASCLGDIGELFPNNDLQYKNISSLRLLEHVDSLLKNNNYAIINIDCVVVCQAPAILTFREAIRRSLAQALQIDISQIFVKGKTAEKIGAIGEGCAVEATAVCLLEKHN